MNVAATSSSHSDGLKRLINVVSTAAEIRVIAIKLEETELKEITVVESVFKADLK
jgi:hypothetical protein